jgi:hypothetical protein
LVNEEVILGGEDDRPQYLKNEDVEITAIKEPFHQQLERELLMQLKENENKEESTRRISAIDKRRTACKNISSDGPTMGRSCY